MIMHWLKYAALIVAGYLLLFYGLVLLALACMMILASFLAVKRWQEERTAHWITRWHEKGWWIR